MYSENWQIARNVNYNSTAFSNIINIAAVINTNLKFSTPWNIKTRKMNSKCCFENFHDAQAPCSPCFIFVNVYFRPHLS